MQEELAKKWIQDLRTTDAVQSQGRLYDGEGYCCLGRLCIVLGKKFFLPGEEPCSLSYRVEGEEFDTLLPKSIMVEAGMQSSSGEYISNGLVCQLSADNDTGKSFAAIASIIEEHWKEL